MTIRGAHELWPFLVLAALTGTLGALGNPAGRSLTPELVPTNLLTGALALRSIAGQAATIAGPAIGGLLFALDPESVYGVGIVLLVISSLILLPIRRPETVEPMEPRPGGAPEPARRHPVHPRRPDHPRRDHARSVRRPVRRLRRTAPLFAKSILHTGPFGLGVLRSSVAVGALIAGIRIARKPLGGRAGRTLLIVVGTFGASMVVFGLSRWFWLSAFALAVSGFVDMFSMNIRSTTVALATPNDLRGRVNAVEGVFIGASNELGAFESGAAAALIGAVPAVVAGGVLTILLALIWPRVFPALARVDRLEDVSPTGRGEVLPVGRAGPASAPEPAD